MDTQKILNLLNSSENEYLKFATKNGTLLTMNRMAIIHRKIQKVFNKLIRMKPLLF